MPFFVARIRATNRPRLVHVRSTAHATYRAAEAAAQAMWPGEDYTIVEADDAREAGLRILAEGNSEGPVLEDGRKACDQG